MPGDRSQALLIPFGPVPAALAERHTVAVGDEPGLGQLAGALLLGGTRIARATEGRKVLVEVGPQAQGVALDDPGGLVAPAMLGEPRFRVTRARADVDPGDPRVAAATRVAAELDDVDASGHENHFA